jgi:hypothetical protein
MGCRKRDDFQPYPQTGRLADSLNLSIDVLRQKVGSDHEIAYSYVVATIKNRGGRFVQRGNAPNFQGGVITLCTCKHRMRTFMGAEDWRGKWVTGFTGINVTGRRANALVYLMKVDQAFESHRDLWYALPEEVREAKSATHHRHGDIYQPKREVGDPFDPGYYVAPCSDHVHAPGSAWHGDIDYVGCSDRKAALLLGNPDHSFLWDRPIIFTPLPLHRGQKKWPDGLDDFLTQLKGEGEP